MTKIFSNQQLPTSPQQIFVSQDENIQMRSVMSVGVWFLVIYVRYLGGYRRPVAAGAAAKLKTRQMLNWSETSIKEGKGTGILNHLLIIHF